MLKFFKTAPTNSLVNFSCYSVPGQSFCLWSSSQLPLTEIQTNKSRERDRTLTLVSYVFPSNSGPSYISAPQSTNIFKKQVGHTAGSRREWGQLGASDGCLQSLLISVEISSLHTHASGYPLCVLVPLKSLGCPRPRLKMTQLYQAGCSLMPYLHPLLSPFPFLCDICSIRKFHSPWPLFSHIWATHMGLLFDLKPKGWTGRKADSGDIIHFLNWIITLYFHDFVTLQKNAGHSYAEA